MKGVFSRFLRTPSLLLFFSWELLFLSSGASFSYGRPFFLYEKQEQKPLVVSDSQGHWLSLSQPPSRIVSLAPNITEILYALGLGDRIVGVTRYCRYPTGAASHEKIGGLVDPHVEKILSLHPDLILAFRGNPLRIIQKLRDFGLPVFALDSGNSLDSVFEVLQKIGAVTWREKEATKLIETLQSRGNEVQARLRPIEKKPTVFLSLQETSLWTCGRDSFLTDLVDKAGGVNVAARIARGWILYNREQLLVDNPDVIIVLTPEPESGRRVRDRWVRTHHLSRLKAVQEGRVYLINDDEASRFGPRLWDALEKLARFFHPECFLDAP